MQYLPDDAIFEKPNIALSMQYLPDDAIFEYCIFRQILHRMVASFCSQIQIFTTSDVPFFHSQKSHSMQYLMWTRTLFSANIACKYCMQYLHAIFKYCILPTDTLIKIVGVMVRVNCQREDILH